MTTIAALQEALKTIAELHAANPMLDPTSAVLRLRKISPSLEREAVGLAVETFFARQVASEKLGRWAEGGFFSADVLEQATRSAIAAYRASFFRGLSHVLEIGTGTGSDTSALARVAGRVTSIESDPLRAELARENLRIQGIDNVSILIGDVAEVLSSLDTASFDGLFADPARRTRDGVRVRDGSDYSPSLEFLINLPIGRVRAIKVSPGLFFNPSCGEWCRHFIGVGDECLEQTLVHGVSITDSSVHLADCGMSWSPPATPPPPLSAPATLSGYITEAHALINRSQHLRSFFAELGIAQLAPDVAYGISNQLPSSGAFLRSFRIVDAAPYSASNLRRTLHSLGWSNRTEIKKRNCALDIDAVRTSLRLSPHSHDAPFGTVFIFRWNGTHHVILAERTGV
jgi:hypothetical protein